MTHPTEINGAAVLESISIGSFTLHRLNTCSFVVLDSNGGRRRYLQPSEDWLQFVRDAAATLDPTKQTTNPV